MKRSRLVTEKLNLLAVSLHEGLLIEPGVAKKMRNLTKDVALLTLLYPPIFLRSKKGYILIARHWVYSLCLENKLHEISALTTEEELLVGEILEVDRVEVELLKKFDPSKKISGSRSTLNREKNRSSGRICPFCGFPLRIRARQKENKEKGIMVVTCERNIKKKESKYFGKGCDFIMTINLYEYSQFVSYSLPIEKMLTPVPDKVCKLCKSQLFKRTVYNENSTTTYERCRNYYSIKKCKYVKKISEEGK